MENYYKLLEIPHDAQISLIRSAFRKKAKTCHPDLFRNASKKFQKIQQKKFVRLSKAYETLSDPKKRKIFDQDLKIKTTNISPPNEQKKQRSSSFSSVKNNFNKKTNFSKESDHSSFTEREDSLEDLINDIEKIMKQLGLRYKDPLEMLVEWAMKIFQDINLNHDEKNENKKNVKEKTHTHKTRSNTYDESLYNVEKELKLLKKIVTSKSKSKDPLNQKIFEDQIDQELLSIKKKYRI